MNPGDVLEGEGALLQHGRLVAQVMYHLTIPQQTHFVINPTKQINFDYDDYLGGFILLSPTDAEKISLSDYTLELANKHRRLIWVERRYKEV